MQASTVLAARVNRESSPPEAILRSGRGTSPGLGRKSISTRSAPISGGEGASGSSQLARLDLDREPGFQQAQWLEPRLDRPREVRGRLSVGRPRARPRRLHGLERRGERCVQVFQVGFVSRDRLELGLGLGTPPDQLVGRAVEPRRQPPVECQPGLDILEPHRVVVPLLAQVAEAVGHLAGLVGQALEGRGGLGQLGHRSRQRLEAAGHPLEDLLGRVIGLVEQGVTLGRGRPERIGVGQEVRLANQLIMLADPGIGPGQLVALELEQGPLPLAGLGRAEQGLPPQAVVLGSRPAIGSAASIELAVGVEQLALAVGIEQGPTLGLAVDVDQCSPSRWRVAIVTGIPLTCAGSGPGPRPAA